MKRNILKIMTLCTVAVLALASCKKDNQPQANVPENGFLATVEANQGNGGRTHLVGSEVQWNAGDQIAVRNGNGTSATFSLSAGENTTEGTFLSSQSGDDFFQPTYTAVYPATGNSITGEGTATITLPATQAYVANSFANGAMPMMAVSGEQTLAFKNMLGGICFPMVGDNLTVTRLVLTSNSADDNLSGVFSADYNNGQPTLTYTSGGANSITLDCGAGVTLDATTATDFTVMVPAGSLANGFKLEAYNGESKVFEKTNDATLGAEFIARSAIKKVNNPLEVVTHEYVDLGLPSGLLWATCNVGANTPEEYGDYFAWAETTPKDIYDWSTYLYAYNNFGSMTKYCANWSDGYMHFTDDLTTLLPEDDAATVNLGSGWRMPTIEEWRELQENTTASWTTQNGVNGRLFTASNGNSLFLPAAGWRVRDTFENVGGKGYYWSSTLYTGQSTRAWILSINPVQVLTVTASPRYYGHNVRPVRSARQN